MGPLCQALQQGGPARPVYLLVGEVSILAKEADELVRSLQSALGGAMVEELRDEEAGPGRILEAVTTNSLFAASKVVKVVNPSGPEFSQQGARRKKTPAPPWLERIEPGRVAVVLLAPAVDAASPLFKWISMNGEVVRPLKGGSARDLEAGAAQLVQAWAEELGVSMDRRAVKELISMVPPTDLAALRHEVEKLASMASARGRNKVTQVEVAEICVTSREDAVYLLTDALGKGGVAGVVEALQRLLQQGVAPLALLNTVANHLRRLLTARTLLDDAGVSAIGSFDTFKNRILPMMEQGAGGKLPPPLMGMKPYGLYKVCGAALRFPRRRLQEALRRMWRFDLLLKGEHPDPAAALEGFLLELVSERGPSG